MVPGITATIERAEPLLRDWPGSAALYLPPPRPHTMFQNRALAATWRRLLADAGGGSREDDSIAHGASSTRASSPRR